MTRYPVFAAGMTHPVNVCTLTGPQPEVEQKALVKSQAEALGWLSLECQSLLNPQGAKNPQGTRWVQLQFRGTQGRLQGW